jgi:hypothetical protein
VYELFAGSGSGVIADLSPASGGTNSGGPGALLTFTDGTSMAWGSKLGYGFTFTVSANKTIKGVGFYDENLNGLTGSYSMLLLADSLDPSYEPFSTKYVAFDVYGETVMSIPGGTTAALSGSWRRVNLASGVAGNVLTSGITYTLFCEPDNTANVDNLIKSASGVTMQSGTSFGQNYSWGTGYSPSTTSGDGTAYFGPMIFFE